MQNIQCSIQYYTQVSTEYTSVPSRLQRVRPTRKPQSMGNIRTKMSKKEITINIFHNVWAF
jgi:hypothetical protein